jgi:hypothetical protein
MEPHEIKPNTELCTILGVNAQIGIARKYFVKAFKYYNLNIAPIALNIKEEHLTITLQGLPKSKIQYTYIEPEYQRGVLTFCNNLNKTAKELEYVDIIETKDEKMFGINLEKEAKALFSDNYQFDNNTMLMAKVLLILQRWYKVDFNVDDIPTIMNK